MSGEITAAASFIAAQPTSSILAKKHTDCCQTHYCGRDWSCLDYVFCGGESTGLGVLGVGGAAYFLQAPIWASATLGGGGCCILAMAGLGHWTWREAKPLRDINEVDKDLEQTADREAVIEHRTEAVAQDLLQGTQQLERENGQLKQTVANLTQNELRLQADNKKFEDEIGVYKQEKDGLEASNKTLKIQVQDLQDSLTKINEHLKVFNQQNNAFKEMLVTQGKSVDFLGKEESKIARDIQGLENHFDGAVATLARQIQDAHKTFDAIVALQAHEKEDLEAQMARLGKDVDALRSLDEALGEKKRQLEELKSQEAAVAGRMAGLQNQCEVLQKELVALAADRDQLSALESHFHADLESLSAIMKQKDKGNAMDDQTDSAALARKTEQLIADIEGIKQGGAA